MQQQERQRLLLFTPLPLVLLAQVDFSIHCLNLQDCRAADDSPSAYVLGNGWRDMPYQPAGPSSPSGGKTSWRHPPCASCPCSLPTS